MRSLSAVGIGCGKWPQQWGDPDTQRRDDVGCINRHDMMSDLYLNMISALAIKLWVFRLHGQSSVFSLQS